ncbi:MAG: PKD domain-containing protein [Gaiellaceae bacterium]
MLGTRIYAASRLALIVALVLLAALVPGAAGAPGDIGYEGRSTAGTSTPTGTKRAESVLWWNDGSWWASMWDSTTQDFHIFKLDTATQTWLDTGVIIDPRANTHADVLWDGTHLYVASHPFVADNEPAVPGFESRLYRFSYEPTTDTYSLDSGFPVLINNYKTETLVIDKDSTGKLWATWMQDNRIYVNRTLGDDRTWGVPFVLPVAATSVTIDDNSSVIAFGGGKIGVMWSNASGPSDGMWFAVHVDGQPDTTWEASRTAIQGPETADDHINLKSLQADGSGRVYAAVKTSFDTGSAPLIMLLVRDPSTGDWSSYPIARVSDCPNRPMVMIDEESNVLHTFFTAPAPPNFACNSSGGAIYEKTSPLDSISFPLGRGDLRILDADSAAVHNASSTKQNVTSQTGLVVLASNGQTARYWHHYDPLAPSAPPTANFSGTPTSGAAPLAVNFTDLSSGSPSSWSWNFGDGGVANVQNPSHTYSSPGTYTVALTVTNTNGTDTATRVDYISVTPPPPDFALSASPSNRTVVRGNGTSYTITVTPSNGFSGPVTLTVSGFPTGATGTFTPNPVGVPAATTSTLSVTTATTTKNGNYTLTIRGTSGALARTTTVTLLIKKK